MKNIQRFIICVLIVSVFGNVYLFNTLYRNTKVGRSMDGDIYRKHIDVFIQLPKAITTVLENPEDEEALNRLFELSEANRALYNISWSGYFLSAELGNKKLLLGIQTDRVVQEYFRGKDLTLLSENEIDEIITFTENLKDAIDPLLGVIGSNKKDAEKSLETLRAIINSNDELTILGGI